MTRFSFSPLHTSLVLVSAAVLGATPGRARAQPITSPHRIEVGVGAGLGTGSFGGPGVAAMVHVGNVSDGFGWGGELVGVVRRERYAEGGAFFPDPGRVRTVTRWAASVVARVGPAQGAFAKGGIGLGLFSRIDRSAQDASPITATFAPVLTTGVGTRWSVGGRPVVPRLDALVHLGRAVRVTGVVGLSVAAF